MIYKEFESILVLEDNGNQNSKESYTKKYQKFIACSYCGNNSKGCVLEIDLQYPKELRELHKDYPIAPDKIEIKVGMLSN